VAGWLAFVSSYLAVVCGAVAIAASLWWAPAVAAGRETYSHRQHLAGPSKQAPESPNRVAWLGDSTIMDPFAYPWVLGKRIDGSETSVMALPGIDAFAFYCALDHELDRTRPKVLGLVAHVGNIHRGYGKPVNDLVSELPVAELPSAIALPLDEFGLTVPQLLLFRVLRWPWAEQALFFLDGIHRLARSALIERWAGPEYLPPLDNWNEMMRGVSVTYSAPFSARTAKVQFLAATVRRARDRGVRALVVVEPLPVHQLQATGHYDAALFAARIAALRGEIERAGGTLVDLHDAIPADGFRDAVGHMNEQGHARAAERLREPMARLLAASPDAS
jgi:hypothetical protein